MKMSGSPVTDRSIVLLELFSGTKSITKVFQAHGAKTFTVDASPEFDPDMVADIMDLEVDDLPEDYRNPDVVWASPPCQAFSVAAIGWNWVKEGRVRYPASDAAADSIILLDKTVALIEELGPRYYFIENPRGMMRHTRAVKSSARRTVTYCQYGDVAQKPTDIWTNCHAWIPRAACQPIEPGDPNPCHDPSPRGSKSGGVQGKSGSMERGIIPLKLCEEIWRAVNGEADQVGQHVLEAFGG